MQYDFIRSERKYKCINNNQVHVTHDHDQTNTMTTIGENFKHWESLNDKKYA